MKKVIALLLVTATLFLVGCVANVHQIGNGSQTGEQITARQWYVLWGLVPLNEVSTNAMAAGATDYQIETKYEFIDMVISYFTGAVTVSCRSVKVTK